MPPKQSTLDKFLKKASPAKTGKGKAEAIDVDTTPSKKRKRGADEEEEAGVTSAAPPQTIKVDSLAATIVDPEWREALAPIINGVNFRNIEKALAAEYKAKKEIFPPREEIFSAFNHTPWSQVRVVIIGQDPYHDNGQAHGLCFSVKPGIKTPPSLVNMYKELTTDIKGFKTPNHGYLTSWAEQGVLMLNATLTVEAHKANSHAKIGWQQFTDDVIKLICRKKQDVVFLLWGGFAQKKMKNCKIDTSAHGVIQTGHPSPLSVKHWTGCKTFSKCNDELVKRGKDPINWQLPLTVSK